MCYIYMEYVSLEFFMVMLGLEFLEGRLKVAYKKI